MITSKADIKEFYKSSVFTMHGGEISKAQVGDRIQFSRLLSNGISIVFMLKANQDHDGADSAISMLVNMIPPAWRTAKFIEDIEKAKYSVEETTYATFCNIPYGQPSTFTTEQTDYEAMLGAVISLLDDMGMLSKKIATEVITGDTPIKEMEKIIRETEAMELEVAKNE